jgi:hypothetical protein
MLPPYMHTGPVIPGGTQIVVYLIQSGDRLPLPGDPNTNAKPPYPGLVVPDGTQALEINTGRRWNYTAAAGWARIDMPGSLQPDQMRDLILLMKQVLTELQTIAIFNEEVMRPAMETLTNQSFVSQAPPALGRSPGLDGR